MRIASVTAGAFGPLVGQKLELAPGLTVIVGRNESAKSSWHAAIYAGLCGRRRGRGAANLVDRRFAELHRPWDGDSWLAEVEVVLDDGRRIQIRQDLAGKVDSRAMDVGLNRDVSNEILNDGSPDGAVWLGLDRESFLATACINQAALKEVLASASALQEYLGRAAASAKADVSAAAALELISDFQKVQVGRDIAHAVRPLKRAIGALESARRARDAAGLAHEAYVGLVTEAEQARSAAVLASQLVEGAVDHETAVDLFVAASRQARRTQEQAADGRQRRETSASALRNQSQALEQIVLLDAEFGGQPPGGLVEAEDAAGEVTDALALWAAAPTPTPLEGVSAQSLREQLEALPAPPIGDTQADESVVRAYADLVAARTRVSEHDNRHPPQAGGDPDPELAAAVAATPAVVRTLAADVAAADALGVNTPDKIARLEHVAVDSRARANELRAAAELAASSGPSTREGGGPSSVIAWAAGALLAVGAVVGFAVGQQAIAAVSGALAVVAVVGGVLLRRRAGVSAATPSEKAEPADWTAASNAERQAIQAEEAHKAAVANARTHQVARSDVEARCAARGLPADATRLRQLAEAVDVWRSQQADEERWRTDHEDAVRSVVTHEERTRLALGEREPAGVDAQRPIDELVEAYKAACRQRSAQAAEATRRPAFVERISQRETAEAEYARTSARRREAAAAVAAAAVSVGVADADAAGQDAEAYAEAWVVGLEAWQRDRLAKAEVLDEARAKWQRLQVLLDGSTVDDLRERLAIAAAAHDVLVVEVAALEDAAATAETARCTCAQAAGLEPGTQPDLHSAEQALEVARRDLGARRSAAEAASAAAERAETVRTERAAGLLSVAEAEEVLAAAQAEYDRVQELGLTLKLTTEFLEQAQERVHRDIAPVLTATLTKWLPHVTDGRYAEAMIDPATLHIQVRAPGGAWRHADRLSVGTAEQIFLLLRMALAQHLAITGETCPLLLDDVTVQADAVRTVQILELLLRVAEERQVILFAQEPSVQEWAVARLQGEKHSVLALEQVASV